MESGPRDMFLGKSSRAYLRDTELGSRHVMMVQAACWQDLVVELDEAALHNTDLIAGDGVHRRRSLPLQAQALHLKIFTKRHCFTVRILQHR